MIDESDYELLMALRVCLDDYACIYCGICCENDICVNCAEAMLESFLTRWGGDE